MPGFSPLPFFTDFATHQLGLYTLQNYFEVAIFITITHATFVWLKQDNTKQLALHGYAYCALLITSYALSCTMVFLALLFLFPVALIFCTVIHQKQLQKNFVVAASKAITPHTLASKNWLEILIRSSLVSSYQRKDILCIIERTDQLESVLAAPYMLSIPIAQSSIDLIFNSSKLESPALVWVQSSGILCSINVAFKPLLMEEILTVGTSSSWSKTMQATQLLTKKTDALVFFVNAHENHYVLWHQGKMVQLTTMDQLLTCCKEIVERKTYQTHGGTRHDQKNNTTHSSSSLH